MKIIMSFINRGINYGTQNGVVSTTSSSSRGSRNNFAVSDGVIGSFHQSGGGGSDDFAEEGEYELIVRNKTTKQIAKTFDMHHPICVNVNGDVTSVSTITGNVQINGSVSKDVSVMTGNVTISGNVGGNVSVVCGLVNKK